MAFCRSCGVALKPGARFCAACGATVSISEAPTLVSARPDDTIARTPTASPPAPYAPGTPPYTPVAPQPQPYPPIAPPPRHSTNRVVWFVAAGVAGVVAALAILIAVLVSRNGHGSPSNAATSPLPVASAPTSIGSTPAPNDTAPTNSPTAVANAAARRWQTYRSPRFGFSFQLPGAYLQSGAAGETDFQDRDGSLSVAVYETPRNSVGPTSAYSAARREFVAEGGRVTYHFHNDNQYVLSGYTANDDVYYQFRYFGRSGVGGFTFRYPRSYPHALSAASEAAITRAYNTFRHGGL